MTNQEAFDKMVAHLRKQGQKAKEDGSCRYRTKDGLMCAVGCLLTDAEYKRSMEGKGVEHMQHLYGVLQDLDPPFLAEMQDTHDAYDPNEWEARFASTAVTYGLVYAPATPIQPATAA
jgi:hypothetical protein